jgi:CP family cyanate transporter-like MFS transporter
MSLIAPIIAGRFHDQRAVTGAALAVCGMRDRVRRTTATAQWSTLWVMCVMTGPGASISLALLFMVLRSTSTTQTVRSRAWRKVLATSSQQSGPLRSARYTM